MTEEELKSNGLLHCIVHNKDSFLYQKEFYSVEAANILAETFGEKITEKDCSFFTKYGEVAAYRREKWEKIIREKYSDFIPVWGKLFAAMTDVDYPY